jgi:anaerobic dimethyl sulfoxide reductase subunit B (iron-sulfur subunit)
MPQFGFFFDQSRCDGCSACVVSCKDWNDLSPGPLKYARLYQWETGTWPTPRVHILFAPCYHCENPVCVDAAEGAMFKEEKYGAVLIDPDKANSPALRKAWIACPYGAVTFESDAPDAKAGMCNMCIDRLEQGMKPICVMACVQRALDFDTLENLQKKYGTLRDMEGMPSSAEVKPAVVFKAALPKKQLVPYDADKALQINATRPAGSGPTLYASPSDVTDIPEGLITRNTLVMKAKNAADFMHYTRDNES